MSLLIRIVVTIGVIFFGMSASLVFAKVTFGDDKASLQRGAAFFMDYCSGCHALKYMRINQLVRDLGLTSRENVIDKKLFFNHLLITHAQSYDSLRVSMPSDEAREWFGVSPPDLSLVARVRTPAWIERYLKNFYSDSSRPFASNNVLVTNSGMPNILLPLESEMSPAELDSVLHDLVYFLDYVAEPDRKNRYLIGICVLLFLNVFLMVVLILYRHRGTNLW